MQGWLILGGDVVSINTLAILKYFPESNHRLDLVHNLINSLHRQASFGFNYVIRIVFSSDFVLVRVGNTLANGGSIVALASYNDGLLQISFGLFDAILGNLWVARIGLESTGKLLLF